MSLLDKTRQELIRIILRKDDVEKRLMDKVKLLEKEKKQLIEKSEKMRIGYSDDDIDAIFDGDLSASWSI
jgi:hypothetical protein